MATGFDKNGNATETHTATVSSFNPVTGEFKTTYEVRILAGTGIPAYSTLTLAPVIQSGFTACWNGVEWVEVTDLRGSTAYNKSDGAAQIIKSLGELDDSLTSLEPSTPYDKWDGEKWVTDTEEQHSAAVDAAEAQRQSLIDAAMASISLIQLKLQAGRKLKQAETTRLNAVLDYIDAVAATDTSTAPDVIWPELPEA
ncbi:tail fiber assembly protein [Escherichia coli]|nr:tail fiber assembly protein [Escherichia coli]